MGTLQVGIKFYSCGNILQARKRSCKEKNFLLKERKKNSPNKTSYYWGCILEFRRASYHSWDDPQKMWPREVPIQKMQTITTFPIDYWKARSPEFLIVIHRAAQRSQVSAKHTWPGSWRKPASLSAGKLCTEGTTTNCLQYTVQGCPILTTPLPCSNADSLSFPNWVMGNPFHTSINKQLDRCQRTTHPGPPCPF